LRVVGGYEFYLSTVGEGDNTVIVEDTSDEEDEETLQERFSCGQGSAALDCPMSPLSTIL
jgi:hypothetical protein